MREGEITEKKRDDKERDEKERRERKTREIKLLTSSSDNSMFKLQVCDVITDFICLYLMPCLQACCPCPHLSYSSFC